MNTLKMQKIKIAVTKFLIAAAFGFAAGNASAEKCYVDAKVYYKRAIGGSSQHSAYLDVFPIELNAKPESAYGGELTIDKEDRARLAAAAEAYAKTRINEIEEKWPLYKGEQFTGSISSKCHSNSAATAESRKEFGKYTENGPLSWHMTLRGDWTKFIVKAGAGNDNAADKVEAKPSQSTSSKAVILTRSSDSSQKTPGQITTQQKAEVAQKKKEKEAIASAKKQAAKDVQARDDKQRKICMQPEHRYDCGCGKYFAPDPTRTGCSK